MSEVRFTKDEMVFYQLSGYWLTNRESRDPIGYEGAYLFKICFINSKFKKIPNTNIPNCSTIVRLLVLDGFPIEIETQISLLHISLDIFIFIP